MSDEPEWILPEKPDGWKFKMSLHMNFGPDGGKGVYDVFDPEGRKAPFGYQYDTRDGGQDGFFAADTDGCLSWVELRAHYAARLPAAALDALGGE
jgi:hypothetical protein